MTFHLLVIDDDERLRLLLKQYLTKSGFDVSVAENPHVADQMLKLFQFDALIMDIMMPGQNGLDYTRVLRKKGWHLPILMLTAMGDVSSRITGLEAGADDYLAKPFDPKELLLRLNNLMKHHRSSDDKISFGPFVYYPNTAQLYKNNQAIRLTQTEHQLWQILFKANNQLVSRNEIAQNVESDTNRTIDVQITRLRRKIEDDPKHPLWIQTVRGEGYKLVR